MGMTRLVRPHQKNRARDSMQNLIGNSAILPPAESGVAMRCHDDEIERMKKEAEHHKEEDKKKAEAIEAKNKADGLVAAAEKALKDAGDKAPKDVKNKVQGKIDRVK